MENNKQMELYSMGVWKITNKCSCILLSVWKKKLAKDAVFPCVYGK
jgi:hypothetical protein